MADLSYEDPSAALLSVVLDRDAGAPLHRQLYAQLRELILSGRIRAGARMASTRRLSQELQVSRTVALAAYEQLALEGYLQGVRGSGHFVPSLDHIRRTAGPAGRAHADPAAPPAGPPPSVPFAPTAAPCDLFPHRTWARLLARGWRRHGVLACELAWAGLPALREALAAHIYSIRGIKCVPEQVLVTAGNADALRIIARTFARACAPARPAAWIEDPGYVGARRELAREGYDIVPVPVDSEGLEVAAGIALGPEPTLALLTPARQFPLGMPLSLGRRLQLLNWARDVGATLIEDDYDSEIRFAGRAIPSLSTLDPEGAILSLGSLSRLSFEGLRLGYVAGPQWLIERLVRTRESEGVLVPTSAQAAMAEFLSSGLFAKHLRNLRANLGRRRKALVETLEAEAGGLVRVLPQEVGMHLTILLERAGPGRDVALAAAAAGLGLQLEPLAGFAIARPAPPGFLLGYAAWPEPALVSAARTLAALIRRHAGR